MLTTRLLALLGSSESAVATLRPDGLELRAVTRRPDAYAARRALLREAAPPGFVIDDHILTLSDDEPLADYCRQALSRLPLQLIGFEQSSSELRTGSAGVLDKLAELAFDCRDMQLAISGHSDASGNESWNLVLSEARARAVADQLQARGIAAARLSVTGRGSAEPLSDDTTAAGRARNRRIEIEASWPQPALAAAD